MSNRLFRLARPLALVLAAALTLLVIFSFLVITRAVLVDPAQVLPDETLWTAAQLETALGALGLPINFYAVYMLGITLVFSLAFLVCGWLILLRHSQDWFGLYLALLLLAWGNGVGVFASAPVVSPWVVQHLLGWFMWPGLILLLYFFPSGHFIPRWTRWFAWSWIVFCVFGLTADLLNSLPEITYALPILFTVLLVGVYAQVYRFRHADALERQQIKLVVFSLVLMAVYFIFIASMINGTGLMVPGQSGLTGAFIIHLLFNLSSNLVFMGIPISIAVAIFRYRLWDVDIIFRRTLVYGALTFTLALVYNGSVVLLQNLLQNFTGQGQSPIVLVVSTLLIAGLFTPLRRRFQTIIDRRFYRRKYDAERTLERFASTLRDEVDIDQLSVHLMAVVQETVQPNGVSVWLRKPKKG